MFDLVLQNCRLLHKHFWLEANIGISNGLIEKFSPQALKGKKTIDCLGKTIIPGLIDAHVHFRTPGEEQKEDWVTASKAALAGGVTTALDMPNNNPPTTTREALLQKRRLVGKSAMVNFGFHFGATDVNEEEFQAAERISSLKVFTARSTGNLLVGRQKTLENVFLHARKKNLVVCVHAEDNEIIEKNSRKFAKLSDPLIHSKVRTAQAEASAIENVLELQKQTKNKLYICHVSSAEGVKLIEEAKEEREGIFCEVTPHHLFLNNKNMERLRNFGKVNPSIKSEKDRLALWKALKNGVVDVVASDHAPHTTTEKKLPYWQAPSGMPGVQTMLPLLLDATAEKKISLEKIIQVCCENPARIFGLKRKGFLDEGFDADITVLDLKKKTRIANKEMFSKCGWTAFAGMVVQGQVEKTIVGGNVVFDNGKFDEKFRAKEAL